MKRFLLVLVFIIVFIIGAGLAVLFGIGYILSPQNSLQKSDAIVAISGGETTSRALEAIKLYKQGWAPKLIFSGAASDPNGPSNALVMKRLAIQQGVQSGDVLIDEASTNTLENAADVAYIVKTHGYKKIILVTSPYHQRRASTAFHVALGNDVTILNHSTIDQTWRRNHWWATEYSRALTWSELKKTLFVLFGGRDTLP
ncbi:MAG TPA: YdcF family protein [Candidatus Nanoarchaeia archaeon]|nr:YdcF family protein [Candidatus Nanoarchaeia archaeon]